MVFAASQSDTNLLRPMSRKPTQDELFALAAGFLLAAVVLAGSLSFASWKQSEDRALQLRQIQQTATINARLTKCLTILEDEGVTP